LSFSPARAVILGRILVTFFAKKIIGPGPYFVPAGPGRGPGPERAGPDFVHSQE